MLGKDKVDLSDKNFEYIGEWYHIKRNNQIIEISVSENTTKKSRNVSTPLIEDNWLNSKIIIDQKAK